MFDKAIEKQPNDLTYYNKCAVWIEMGPDHHDAVLTACKDLLAWRCSINDRGAASRLHTTSTTMCCMGGVAGHSAHRQPGRRATVHESP